MLFLNVSASFRWKSSQLSKLDHIDQSLQFSLKCLQVLQLIAVVFSPFSVPTGIPCLSVKLLSQVVAVCQERQESIAMPQRTPVCDSVFRPGCLSLASLETISQMKLYAGLSTPLQRKATHRHALVEYSNGQMYIHRGVKYIHFLQPLSGTTKEIWLRVRLWWELWAPSSV